MVEHAADNPPFFLFCFFILKILKSTGVTTNIFFDEKNREEKCFYFQFWLPISLRKFRRRKLRSSQINPN